ncbi:MAG: hypothetical protein WB492_04680 [Christiangramia sp.]
MKEIFDLTCAFQTKFPEIYENLLETPLFLTYKGTDTSQKEFKNYLDFLKTQLRIFEEEKANNTLTTL